MTTFINGRFLTQHTSGVQRFAQEVVKALDVRFQSKPPREDWELAIPPGALRGLDLKVIRERVVGRKSGHLWEQTELWWHSRGGRLVNLCNSGPVMHLSSLTVIHDAMIYRTPQNFSRAYRTLHGTLGHLLARTSCIATVSEFSRRELLDVVGVKAVAVIPNSCEHVAGVTPDPAVLERLGLDAKGYLLFVGSPAPNKNLKAAIAGLERLGAAAPKFVIVGAAQKAVFSGAAEGDSSKVIFSGRLSDAEIVALYRNALALLFPSLYEGFGIPPLEAMVLGCPVLSSDIPPVREVCGDTARYFDARDPAAIAVAVKAFLDSPETHAEMARRGMAHAAAFSWQRSAEALLTALDR
ncbi:glycosyltransferase family 4 protein [Xanthobacter autotrophicus]|uniref:glycosyltransferase family 4 protein n=1 Tax=Xanthobacter TaxID=279 RepID=UPI0024AA7259|nr:glycosyltransferase family 1 protein [Xanthobacter autotrophicus]MDI4664836.1 glycosyltransferase family 4 protein [Xanthobacter autotrophicus]